MIGMFGGSLAILSSVLIDRIHVDDPVAASSVHGTCGIWVCIEALRFD